MFIQNLGPEQQSLMLYLVKMVVEADNHFSNEEKAMLEILKSQCDENVSEADSVSISALREIFKTTREKSSLLLELLGISYADGDYHEREEEVVKEIAQAIDIDDAKLSDMVVWVQRQLILTKEAEMFMED